MSSANSIGFRISDTFSISFIYKIKSNGPNIDPCGTPHVISCVIKIAFKPVADSASYTVALKFIY